METVLTPYQLWQLETKGDILPEQSGGGVQGVSVPWFDRQVEQQEITEPNTGTHTSVFA